jgi:transposase-like protein
MNKIKRAFSSAFKAKVALDLIRGSETIAQACSRHGIHPTQAGLWKSQMLKNAATIFDNKPDMQLAEKESLIDQLYHQVGKLQTELDWLKKKTNTS